MAHQDRLETLASIQRGYETADAVNQQLHAMLDQLGTSEATRFVRAAQEERAILQRVIHDQKAHALAAVDTMNRLQRLHVEQSERERAVHAAAQLRLREFQIARWWAGVQHSLTLETAQRNASETALSAEYLEDRRVWQESLLAARASASVARKAEGNEEERAAAVRREVSAVAAITARIYEQVSATLSGFDLIILSSFIPASLRACVLACAARARVCCVGCGAVACESPGSDCRRRS